MVTPNTNGGETATVKKQATRLKSPEQMDADERKIYDALPEMKKPEYDIKLKQQNAADELKALRDKQDAERKAAKVTRDRETGIKGIIKDVRSGELADTEDSTLTPRLEALGIPEADRAKVIERIKTDSVKATQNRLTPATPAYQIERRLVMVTKDEVEAPTDGGRPDITLINNANKFNVLLPVVVRVSPDNPDKFRILDGKRRYYLMPDNAEFQVMLITGFPDEVTAEKAEVAVNRIRSLNILSVASTLMDMKTRGIDDKEIRRDMGFKTGEIDKITSVISGLSKDMAEALKAGHITPTVAIAIAKLPKELQTELHKAYKLKLKDNPDARISEADVTAIRSKRAEDAVSRDTPVLSGLAEGVEDFTETKGAELDGAAEKAVVSKDKPKAKSGGKKSDEKTK